ncbi:hypothetical protein SISSUDRAFT_1041695 [Sistotremastrum suecicum HHB10207 ss-3]|uniref:Uncharacterized protein n=2 Tax=Sistotremastraceae TaxID=3402574 RepID=A0A166H646_9AGAM|nr:hypothetical protein SISSUDRAFT_1041695 [Sistotremastrum suecicum HHB10207 ss-3]
MLSVLLDAFDDWTTDMSSLCYSSVASPVLFTYVYLFLGLDLDDIDVDNKIDIYI